MRSFIGLALLLCVVAGMASAQQVIWKCRDGRGAETFQNAPCGAGSREVRAKVYETPLDTPQAVARSERIQQEMDQRNAALHQPVYLSQPYRPPSARQLKQAQCDAARRDALDAARRGVMLPNREWYERRAIDACFGL